MHESITLWHLCIHPCMHQRDVQHEWCVPESSRDVWDAYLWALFLGQEVDAFIVPYMGIMHPVFLQASVHALLIYATSGAEMDAFIVPYKGYPHLACCSGWVPFRAQNGAVDDLVCLGTFCARHYVKGRAA